MQSLFPCRVVLMERSRRLVRRASVVIAAMLAIVAHAAPGELDVSFGASGQVDPVLQGVSDSRAGDLAIQADGKLLLAAACGRAPERLCVARRMPDGSPDPSFGLRGMVIFQDTLSSSGLQLRIALLRDGKALVAMTCESELFCVVRLMPNGSLDGSFGSNGKVTIRSGVVSAQLSAFSVQRDGKLLLAGNCIAAPGESQQPEMACIARVHAGGTLDVTFGNAGVAFIEAPATVRVGTVLSVLVKELRDGGLVVSGRCQVIRAADVDAQDGCVFRLREDGSLDSRFGRGGFAIAMMNEARRMIAPTSALRADESLVIAGICDSADRQGYIRACFASVDRNGNQTNILDAPTTNVELSGASALHAQRDGTALFAGRCGASLATARGCVFRYNADGSFDVGWPTVTSTRERSASNATAIQQDGKVVVVTTYSQDPSSNAISLSRYDGGPFSADQCSLDIDGDGSINAVVDGLILARVTLGFNGAYVSDGIRFPRAARRTQWGGGGEDDLRKFLVSQCGLKLPT